MTDDLKERLRQSLAMSMFLRPDGLYAELESQRKEALARITELEARLAAAEAGEDALAEALREIANCGQSAEPDHWKFRCMAREKAHAALAAYEARREK